MFRKFLIMPFTTISLAAFAMAGPAAAQKPGDPKTNATTVKSTKSNGSFKVTAVDAKARTFTGASEDGKPLTFKLARGALPQAGKFYDITYTESPGAGPLQATTVKLDPFDGIRLKIAAVDAKARTFTGTAAGKRFTFAAAKNGPLPAVGSTHPVKISQDPKTGELSACCVRGTKSNGSE